MKFGPKNLVTFAGPNMVESESLIMDIAKNVKKLEQIFLEVELLSPSHFHIEVKNIMKQEKKVLNG